MKDLTPETSAMMPLPWKKSANYAFAIFSLQTTQALSTRDEQMKDLTPTPRP